MRNLNQRFYSPKLTNQTPHEYRQHVMLTIVAPVGSIIFSLLAFYDAFILQLGLIAFIPAILAGSFLTSFVLYKITKDKNLCIWLFTISVIAVLLIFTYKNQNEDFGLVWALLFPTSITMALGHKRGWKIAVLVYFMLLAILYDGLDIWLNGNWNSTGLIRFSLAYLTSIFMVYVLASSNKQVYQALERQHLDQKKQKELVEKIAITDSITGVFNRHHLNQTMQQLPHHEFEQQQANLVFFILEIDWFKNYVDYYGFQQGDELLITISNLIKKQLKAVNGSVYRVGGSQFSGFSIEQDITKMLIQINEIETLLNEMAIPHEISPEQQVHVSIGMVTCNRFKQFDFSECYRQAEKALFQAFGAPNHKVMVIDLRVEAKLNRKA